MWFNMLKSPGSNAYIDHLHDVHMTCRMLTVEYDLINFSASHLEITGFRSLASNLLLELAAGLEHHDGANAVVRHKDVTILVDGHVDGLDKLVVGEGADGVAVQTHLGHHLGPPVHLLIIRKM